MPAGSPDVTAIVGSVFILVTCPAARG